MAIILLCFEQIVEYYLEFSKNVTLENRKIYPVNAPDPAPDSHMRAPAI